MSHVIPSQLMPRDGGRLRVIMAAFSCSPGGGSELKVGWDAVRAVAPLHDLTVVTRSRFKGAIEAEVARVGGDLARVSFEYLDVEWLPVERVEKLFMGDNWAYLAWQTKLRRWLAPRAGEFDVAHHITYVRYWMASGASRHPGLPFVFGPVGGADTAPAALGATLSRRGRLVHLARDAVRRVFAASPALRRSVSSPSVVCLATTPATAEALRRLGARDVRLASDGYVDLESVVAPPGGPPPEPPVVICSGRLIEWKAHHLAIEAWVRAKIPGTLEIYGKGPSRERLEELVRRLGIEDSVRFRGHVDRSEFLAALGRARLLLHTSLHDSGGQVVIEAFQNGLPAVCWWHAGPGQTVNETCGVRVPVTDGSAEDALERMAVEIRRLATDDDAWLTAARGAVERVRSALSIESYGKALDASYRAAAGTPLSDGASTSG